MHGMYLSRFRLNVTLTVTNVKNVTVKVTFNLTLQVHPTDKSLLTFL